MVQRQPHAGAVGDDVDDPAACVENIHTAQLHVRVILHVGQLVGVALAHLIHGRCRTNACIDAEAHLVHHALVVQHHALELEDGLLAGRSAVCHGFQLVLRRADGIGEQLQFLDGLKGPTVVVSTWCSRRLTCPSTRPGEAQEPLYTFMFGHLRQSSASGVVRVRQTSACKRYWAAARPVRPAPHRHCPQTAVQSSASVPDRTLQGNASHKVWVV